MKIVERADPEWDRMWDRLASALPHHGIPGDLEAGEGWQYMGSTLQTHEFRNRMVETPQGERRVYARVPYPFTRNEVVDVVICPEPAAPLVAVHRARTTINESAITGVLGADGNCYSDADPGL